MNAYFFTAGITQTQLRAALDQAPQRLETWDSCVSIVVYGGNSDEAKNQFEAWLHSSPDDGNPIQVNIRKVVTAPLVNQLFTEWGSKEIDWEHISAIADASSNESEVDYFEQGYWANVNGLVPTQNLPPSVEALRNDLPEDIRSGLNWLPEKTFYFLVSVLCPRVSTSDAWRQSDHSMLRAGQRADEDSEEDEGERSGSISFPELVDKKAAALVQARNSVVAGWLWRRFTVAKGLPANEIKIDCWCGAIPADAPPDGVASK